MTIALVNKRAPGTEIQVIDSLTVPATAPYEVRLTEVPRRYVNTILNGATTMYEQVSDNAMPRPGYFVGDYDSGKLTFNAADAGKAIVVTYMGTGSVAWAEDFAELDTAKFNTIELEIVAARGDCVSLGERIDTALNPDGTIKSAWLAGAGGTNAITEDGVDVALFPTKINFAHGLDVTVTANPSGIASIAIDESELDPTLIPITPDGWVTATNLQAVIGQIVRRVILPGYTYAEILALPTNQKANGELFNVTDYGRVGMWNGTDCIM